MATRRWRHYESAAGRRPVKEFLGTLDDNDAAAVAAAMKEVQEEDMRSASRREAGGRSQTAVATEMKTSQSSVARLEGSADDARLSTIDRYADALGFRIQWHLLPLEGSEQEPPVVVHGAG
jgi:hypothetical protein